MPSFTLPISEIYKIESEKVYFMKVNIESNATLIGEMRESVGMCINFFVLDEANMKNWLNNRTFTAYAKAQTVGKYNFTFTTDHDGTYYFVFDNREFYVHAPCSDKVIIFKLKRQE
ncbi:MAG: hypothetical protein JTT11_10165 [Candidatus Brockarchaeota archaeon]|nr:hypothetical protein [Candidatus Brockarchaeota archaeon]